MQILWVPVDFKVARGLKNETRRCICMHRKRHLTILLSPALKYHIIWNIWFLSLVWYFTGLNLVKPWRASRTSQNRCPPAGAYKPRVVYRRRQKHRKPWTRGRAQPGRELAIWWICSSIQRSTWRQWLSRGSLAKGRSASFCQFISSAWMIVLRGASDVLQVRSGSRRVWGTLWKRSCSVASQNSMVVNGAGRDSNAGRPHEGPVRGLEVCEPTRNQPRGDPDSNSVCTAGRGCPTLIKAAKTRRGKLTTKIYKVALASDQRSDRERNEDQGGSKKSRRKSGRVELHSEIYKRTKAQALKGRWHLGIRNEGRFIAFTFIEHTKCLQQNYLY